MDLRQLERWTREALVAEAERRGVTSAALLTRKELLDAIAAEAEQRGEKVTRSAVSRARRFLERLAFGGATPASTDSAASTPPPSTDPSPAAVTRVAAATPIDTHRAPQPEPEPEPMVDATTAEPVAAPLVEPVPTRTMARLLAAQGHITRARTIYDALLGSVPDDPTLHQEVSALLAPATVEPALRAVIGVTPPVRRAVDLVTALVVDPTTLFVCWEVTDAGVRRARAVAGEGAPVSLHVMIAASDAGGRVTTRELTQDALPDVGETFVTGLPPGALCTAAVGVSGTRFVAIAHAPPAETPPATPSTSLSLTARAHPLASRSTLDDRSATSLAPTETTARLAESARADALEAAEASAARGAVAPSSPSGPGGGPGGLPSSPGAYGSRP